MNDDIIGARHDIDKEVRRCLFPVEPNQSWRSLRCNELNLLLFFLRKIAIYISTTSLASNQSQIWWIERGRVVQNELKIDIVRPWNSHLSCLGLLFHLNCGVSELTIRWRL